MKHRAAYQQFATVVEVSPDGAATLFAFGDIDLTTADVLERAIDDIVLVNGVPVINFTRVRYLDSSGLAVLTRVRKRLGRPLTIITRANSTVDRVLHIVGFDAIFRIVPELSSAALGVGVPLETAFETVSPAD